MNLHRLCLSVILLCCSYFISNAQEKASKPSVKVSGEVTKPLILTMDDLVKMKPVSTSMKDRAGTDHNYKGVAMQELLDMAGVTMDKQLRGENLGKYLLVKCADGYEVVFSLAELDSSFTDRVVTLVYESDGKPLPANVGPFRLVVPGEKKPARSSFQVVALLIKFAKE
ncbi:MAG: molybdopterin-dependent oxidoreductase [Chitinophagaceae bacterium]